MASRGNRRREVGLVVSDKGDKTITVQVRQLVRHRTYGKYVHQTTRCYVHDEQNAASVGDKVEIMESRPMSKMKRWRLVNVLEKATI